MYGNGDGSVNANTLKVLCRIRYYVVIVSTCVCAGIFWGWVVSVVLEALFGISQHTARVFVLPSVIAVVTVWGWKKVPHIWELEKDDCWKN